MPLPGHMTVTFINGMKIIPFGQFGLLISRKSWEKIPLTFGVINPEYPRGTDLLIHREGKDEYT